MITQINIVNHLAFVPPFSPKYYFWTTMEINVRLNLIENVNRLYNRLYDHILDGITNEI